MKIGTYYYPEQWPRQQWERDFDNIAAMGLKIVHMAEFAWHSLEPAPGEFHFDWLDECLNLARKRNLDVILCTPTASPPIWLSHDSPQTLPIDEHGTRARFGGRRHYSPTSSSLHEATRRIVTRMADRYGNHPSVIGWQIDNEYGYEPFDQSPETHAAFRAWLQRKYQTIDALNRAWGCQFWNTYYSSFDQILLSRDRTLRYDNPHQLLDSQRFWSWAFANFNKLQADILKPRVGDRFITTNFMPFYLGVDPAEFKNDLTLFAWDSYPVAGAGRAMTDENYRLPDPSSLAIVHDQMASYCNRWALLEVQVGQTNWSQVPVLLYPGTVRLMLWLAYAHGAEFLTTYRFRQPRFGTELFHHGLVGPDGTTPSAGGREFMQVIDEMKLLDSAAPDKSVRAPASIAPAPIAPASIAPASIAPAIGLIFDFDQLWCYAALQQARRWSQPAWLTRWYSSIARLGLPVKLLHPHQPIPNELPIVIAPGVQMVDNAMIEKWDRYASLGGNLLLTCRTALMDRTGQLFEGPLAEPILDLIGARIEAYDGLPDDTFGHVDLDGQQFAWGVWGDLLYAEPTTKILAKYADQFYAGAAAITRAKHGTGTVTYCGVHGEQNLCDALLEKLAGEFRLPVTVLPPRVHLARRGAHNIAMNFQTQPVRIAVPAGTKFLVGSETLQPAGVAVWI